MGSFFKKHPNPYTIAFKLALVVFLLQVVFRYDLHPVTVETVLMAIHEAHMVFALLTLLVGVIFRDLNSIQDIEFQKTIWCRFFLACVVSISSILVASIYCSSSTVECVNTIVFTHHTVTLRAYRVIFPRLDLVSAVTGIILSAVLLIYSCHDWYKLFFKK